MRRPCGLGGGFSRRLPRLSGLMWRRGATGDRGAGFTGVRQRSFAASDGRPRRPQADVPLVDGPGKGAFRVIRNEAHPVFPTFCFNADRGRRDGSGRAHAREQGPYSLLRGGWAAVGREVVSALAVESSPAWCPTAFRTGPCGTEHGHPAVSGGIVRRRRPHERLRQPGLSRATVAGR